MEDIEKLVKALRHISCDGDDCMHCPCDDYRGDHKSGACDDGTRMAAASALEALRDENAYIRSSCYAEEAVQAIIDERDAAVKDISVVAYHERKMPCFVCVHKDAFGDELRKHCQNCNQFNSHFEWRGPQEAGEGETARV